MRVSVLCLVAIGVATLGCESKAPPPAKPSAAKQTAAKSKAKPEKPPLPWKAAAIAHAGVMTPPDAGSAGCRLAVQAALAELKKGADPIDAAVAGVVVLEDNPTFNAGTGSMIRLDGKTVQMDAATADSDGHFGAVAVIEEVKNPVKVARAVSRSPHRLIAGDGATAFARALGMPVYDPRTAQRKAQALMLRQKLIRKDPSLPAAWHAFDWRKAWNFKKTLNEAGIKEGQAGSDTVGVVVRSSDGRFASALSTGGWTIALRGRVGDVPIRGAGLFAGPMGAAAATGTGERIVDEMGAWQVVHRISEGQSPTQATQALVKAIKGTGSIGVIAPSATEIAASADRSMAWAAREQDSDQWLGTEPPQP